MNKGVGNRRLLKLAAFLRELPKDRFDYGQWVGWDWEGAKDLSCGTVACALGWATAMPEFQRLGLHLKKSDWGVYVSMPGAEDDSIGAAQKVFGLSYDEAEFLFDPGSRLGNKRAPGSKATPQKVAAHIEAFVEARRA